MKNTFIAAIAAFFMAGAVSAAEVTGEVEVSVDGDAVATTELTLRFSTGEDGIANGSISFDENGIDGYTIGTNVTGVSLSYGKHDDDIMIDPGLNVVGATTLADAASAETSLIAGYGAGQMLLGFGDDLTDIDNLQFSYDMGMVVASVDYNVDTEDYTVMGMGTYSFAGIESGLVVSYADTFAYEVSASRYGVTAFVNGDENDALQNVGAGYETTVRGLTFYAEAEYNLDAEEVTPAVGVSFSF
jgi:hypothetical protein